jgi:hypothetical protein
VCAVAHAKCGSSTSDAGSRDSRLTNTAGGSRRLSLGTAVVAWWEQSEQSSKVALAMLGFPGSVVAALSLSAVAATSCTFPPEQTSTQSPGEPWDVARAGIRTGMSECSSNASIATSDTFQRSRRRASMRTSIDEVPVPDKRGGATATAAGGHYQLTGRETCE